MVTKIKKGQTKEQIKSLLKRIGKQKKSNYIDLKKYSGSISLSEDPLIYQKQSRDEWE